MPRVVQSLKGSSGGAWSAGGWPYIDIEVQLPALAVSPSYAALATEAKVLHRAAVYSQQW